MAIPILASAFTIYIFGISAVLFLKPKIMFGEGGEWKEFGIGRGERRTIFPFWLFSIFWAFISYGLALVIMSQFAATAINAFPEQTPISQMQQIQQPSITTVPQQMPSVNQPLQPVQTVQPMQPVQPMQMSTTLPAQQPLPASFMKPVSSSLGIQASSPGYYILQTNNLGQSQYVYYGTEPPKF